MEAPENKSPCPDCPECGGLGFTMKDDMTQLECPRLFWRRVGQKLGTEIATAPGIADTPLHSRTDVQPVVDRTTKNLFLKGWWSDLLPHFKIAFLRKFFLVAKVEGFYFRIVTDERLKNVYLSNEAYAAKQKKKRDEGETYNSLGDLVGGSYDLVVIRLGFLGYKNVAMPGILKETLMLRQALNLPTWIVEEPESIFGQGHFSWSLEVDEYIRRRFEVIDLTQEKPDIVIEPRGVEGARPRVTKEKDDGMSVDEEEPTPSPPKRMPAARFISEERSDEKPKTSALDSVLVGDGGFKKRKKSGGGPV